MSNRHSQPNWCVTSWQQAILSPLRTMNKLAKFVRFAAPCKALENL